MIHRAILGSIERFFGTLIEHYGGAFPVWLAPSQILMIPIKKEHEAYSQKLKENLQKENLRVIIDDRNESLNKRIREATIRKIPYIFILGDKEINDNKIAVRRYGKGDLGTMGLDDFIKNIRHEIDHKQ